MTTTEKADKVLQMIVHVEMAILSLKSDLINGSMFFSKEEIEQRIEWRIKK